MSKQNARVRNEIKSAVSAAVTAANSVPSGKRRRKRRSQNSKAINKLAVSTGRLAINAGAVRGPGRNPADPRMGGALIKLGTTPEGIAWVIRHLHPNGEGLCGGIKIPDGALSTSVGMERRDEFELTMPSSVTSDTWTCIIFCFPLLYRHTIAYVPLPGSTSSPSDFQRHISAILTRVLFKSTSTLYSQCQYPNWLSVVQWGDSGTAATTLGMLTMLPSDIYPNGGVTAGSAAADFREIRRTFLGYTMELNAPALSDQGRIVAGQFAPDNVVQMIDRNMMYIEALAAATDKSLGEARVLCLETPPVSEQDIVQTDRLCYQGEAKEHIYLPMRCWTKERPPVPLVRSSPPVFTNKGYLTENRPTSTTNVSHTFSNTNEYENNSGELAFSSFGTAVVRFIGISKSASIRIKRKEGLEGVAAGNTTVSAFQTEGLADDPRASAFVAEFSRTNPHGYLGRYNSMGDMFKNIFGRIGSVITNISHLPVIKSLPFVGEVAPYAAKFGNWLDEIVGTRDKSVSNWQ